MNTMKTWMQLGAAVVMAIWAALTDADTTDRITNAEWIVVASIAVGAIGVYIVPNMEATAGRYAKGVVSFLTAALPALSLSIAGGLTQAEMVEAIVVGLAATGLVTVTGNRGYVFAHKNTVGSVARGPL